MMRMRLRAARLRYYRSPLKETRTRHRVSSSRRRGEHGIGLLRTLSPRHQIRWRRGLERYTSGLQVSVQGHSHQRGGRRRWSSCRLSRSGQYRYIRYRGRKRYRFMCGGGRSGLVADGSVEASRGGWTLGSMVTSSWSIRIATNQWNLIGFPVTSFLLFLLYVYSIKSTIFS